MVGSFYDPTLDEGCAFEELISFHGGIGGLADAPFILAPRALRSPRRRSSAPPRCTSCCGAGGTRCKAAGSGAPVGGRPPLGDGRRATPDPRPTRCATLRSRRFIVLLVIAALVGVVASIVAWAFLELLHGIQQFVYTDLPRISGSTTRRAGGRCPCSRSPA
jgi:hypothetical protein